MKMKKNPIRKISKVPKDRAPRRPRIEDSVARYPQLVRELDTERNPPGLLPEQVARSSNKKLAWRCPKHDDHRWLESPNKRTAPSRNAKGQGGCPFCGNMRVCVSNSLATVRPDLAAEWHARKNGALTPADVTSRTTRLVWWQDASGNEWEAQVRWRTTQTGKNPYVTGHRLAPERSLAAVRPELVREWDTELNKGLTPETVAAHSTRVVWWRDPDRDDPAWQATPADRVRGRGSPYLNGHKASPANCLARLRPELSIEWHPSKNGSLTAKDVTAQSSREVWWQCRICAKDWRATPKNRGLGTGCPHCMRVGLSRAQHRVAWELRYCFDDIPTGRAKVPVQRIAYEGQQRVRPYREVDILLPSIRVAIEYDGLYWHRDSAEDDTRKTAELHAAGFRVLRLREEGLPLLGKDDYFVTVDGGNKAPHVVAQGIIRILQEWGLPVPRGDEYLAFDAPVHVEEAEREWAAMASRRRPLKAKT